MEELRIAQQFQHLIARGQVDPITCPREDAIMLYHFDHKKEQVYYACLVCDNKIYPGLNVFRDMQRVIDENG